MVFSKLWRRIVWPLFFLEETRPFLDSPWEYKPHTKTLDQNHVKNSSKWPSPFLSISEYFKNLVCQVFLFGHICSCWIPIGKPHNISEPHLKKISFASSNYSKTVCPDLNFQNIWITKFQIMTSNGLQKCCIFHSASNQVSLASNKVHLLSQLHPCLCECLPNLKMLSLQSCSFAKSLV